MSKHTTRHIIADSEQFVRDAIASGSKSFRYFDTEGELHEFNLKSEKDYTDLGRCINRIRRSQFKHTCTTLTGELYAYLFSLREKKQEIGKFEVKKVFNEDLLKQLARKQSTIVEYVPIDRNDAPTYMSVLKAELKNLFDEVKRINSAGWWRVESQTAGLTWDCSWNGLKRENNTLEKLYAEFLLKAGII